MILRDARASDAARLLEIYAWYVENTAVSFEYDAPSLDEFLGRMERTTAKYPWLVVEEAGRVMGYAYAGPFKGRPSYDWSCEITVYLDHRARGRGLGRALYGALEEALGEMGLLNLYAYVSWAEVEDDILTRDSPRFHERMGYTLAGRFHRCGCKFGRWFDMVVMEKAIGPHDPDPEPVRWRGSGISIEG